MHTKQVLFALFACTSSVLAQPQGIPGSDGYVKLVKACQDKQTNAVCEVDGISGTCQDVNDAYLVCKIST
jgi:hypothetical protein